MAEAELHKERLQAIAVSPFRFTCSFVRSRGLQREGGGDSGAVPGKRPESLSSAKLCVEFPFGERVVKVCFAGFAGERGL